MRNNEFIKSKASIIKLIFVTILCIILFITSGCSFIKIKNPFSKGNISSLVSQGVNLNDLGNISSGQYYFIDGTDQYYSSFDKNNLPHIYKTDKDGNTKSIFNGFGWSLVVNGDWLYFSGNEGTAIDGTYNLLRLKKDGSALENLNKGYCYGMSFYGEWIYYIKKNASANDKNICRSGSDGTNEQVISADSNGFCVVYENMLYFTSKSGILYKSNPDGTNKVQLFEENIYYAIIGNGKFVYLDTSYNINTADINGNNRKILKAADSKPIYNINSYKDTVFYTQKGDIAAEGGYVYPYTLSSIKSDGTDDKKIYDGISYGMYINIVKDKVYVMDYAIDATSGKMPAIARSMDLNGGNLSDLFR